MNSDLTGRGASLRRCPTCTLLVSTWPPAWRNHELTHQPGGHPTIGSRRSRPENCQQCGVHLISQMEARRAGACRYAGNGICDRCSKRARNRTVQPLGTPRATPYPQALLVAEVRQLMSAGVHDPFEQADRLGMKRLSFKRAVNRARKAGLLPPVNYALREAA